MQQLGLQDKCEIIHLDFRDYECEQLYDKSACVGAVEHVPTAGLNAFFEHAKKPLKPGGLFLNHGITSSLVEDHPSGLSFVASYVFPDYEVTLTTTVLTIAPR